MVEKLNVYTLALANDSTTSKRKYVDVVAGSLTEAIKTYLKSISSVDESLITSVAIHLYDVLV